MFIDWDNFISENEKNIFVCVFSDLRFIRSHPYENKKGLRFLTILHAQKFQQRDLFQQNIQLFNFENFQHKM